MPASQTTGSRPRRSALASDSRSVTGRGGASAQRPRRRRGRDRGRAALRCRTAATDADSHVERRRSRLSRRPRVDDDWSTHSDRVTRLRTRCCSSSRRSSDEIRRSAWGPATWPGPARCRWARRRAADMSSRSSATRRWTTVSCPPPTYQIVSPTYFETIDVPVVAGRPFDNRDNRGSAAVCMVNEAFVRKHLGGRSPIGMRIAVPLESQPQSAARRARDCRRRTASQGASG